MQDQHLPKPKHTLALQAQGLNSPLGSLDLLEDLKPEQRKHNPAAYTGQVL